MIKFTGKVDLKIDRRAVAKLTSSPEAQEGVHEAAREILADAKDNLATMGAVDTGHLRDSGHVNYEGDDAEVVFDAEYAQYVHEGQSTSAHKGPRPFLANAAYKNRGRL